jgi:hypothetical protein
VARDSPEGIADCVKPRGPIDRRLHKIDVAVTQKRRVKQIVRRLIFQGKCRCHHLGQPFVDDRFGKNTYIKADPEADGNIDLVAIKVHHS